MLLDSPAVFTMRERLAAPRRRWPRPVSPRRGVVRDGSVTRPTAARAVAEMLDAPDPPTAFFGLNNRITVGVLQELWRRGSAPAWSASTTSSCRT